MKNLLATLTTTISELTANPNKVLDQASHEPVVILSQNKPWAYLVPPDTFEKMQEQLEDYQLLQKAHQRMDDKTVSVTIAELRARIQDHSRT